MSEVRSASGGEGCFACSQTNPIGLKIHFEMQGDVCVGRFTPDVHHVGFDGVVHGGLIFTALDDVMANWLHLQGEAGFTAKAAVRYRLPAKVGETLRLEGTQISRRRRHVQLSGKALREADSVLVADVEGTFMLNPVAAATDME
ncbi:MAG: hotdog fold domain-containing protein [Pseudomonadota bacterium]